MNNKVKKIKVKDLKPKDEILLDVFHMDEQPHRILEKRNVKNLFDENKNEISFYVELPNRERFFTFNFDPEDTVSAISYEPKIRKKTRRNRIKSRRSKRNNRRFYCYSSDGKVRARKTETIRCGKASSV